MKLSLIFLISKQLLKDTSLRVNDLIKFWKKKVKYIILFEKNHSSLNFILSLSYNIRNEVFSSSAPNNLYIGYAGSTFMLPLFFKISF